MRKKGIEKFKYKGLYPRTDGISGTLTSVLKDNLVLEPIVIGSMQANAYVGPADGVSPCLTSAMGEGGGHIPMITELAPPKRIFIRYGYGFGQQGFSEDVAYTINSSSFEQNNFIVEINDNLQQAENQCV